MKSKTILILLSFAIVLSFFVGANIWQYNPGGSDPSLVGYWKFDGNANDSSGNGNHGTVSGATYTNKGKFKGAYEFDGVDNIIQIPAFGYALSNFTMALWFNQKKDGTAQDIILNTVDFTIRISATGNGIRFYLDGTWTGFAYFNLNTWNYVAITYDSNNQTIYLNGQQKSTVNNVGDSLSSTILEIGDNWGASEANFNGIIDEVRIYNRSLSQAEILELYNQSLLSHSFTIKGSPTLGGGLEKDPDLFCYLKFDGNLDDSSNNGVNDWTATSGGVFTNQGKFKGAFSNTGSIQAVSATPFKAVNFTFTGWSRNTATYLFYYGGGGYRAYVTTKFGGQIYNGAAWGGLESFTTLSNAKWNFVGMTFDNSTGNMSLYVNGVLDRTAYVGKVVFPVYTVYTGWTGIFDEFRFYNRSLNADEILQLYNQSLNSNKFIIKGSPTQSLLTDSSLVSKWSLDGNANDYKGLNNGTISGATYTNKGRFKGAYGFDGVNDYISATNSSNLDINGSMSISLWVRRNSFGTSQGMIAKGGNGQYAPYTLIWHTTNQLYFLQSVIGTDWTTLVLSSNTITDSNWHHIVAINNGTEASIYFDGVKDATVDNTPATYLWKNSVSVTIGCETQPSTGTRGRFFNGTIDEVMIFNRSLSAGEIRQLYNQSLSSNKFTIKGNPDAN